MTRVYSVPLPEAAFAALPRVVVATEGFTATAHVWPTGVHGLRLENEVGHLELLPFKGQQIWDAVFRDRRLTMRSMFDVPRLSADYLSNYGAFFLHCGASAMGNPSPSDVHPLHGELPNARYENVCLTVGEDRSGVFMELTGETRQTRAFTYDYLARPTVKLRSASAIVEVTMEIRNCKRSPMELMYLGHINFRPVDGSRLIDTVADDHLDIVVRGSLPAGIEPDVVSAGYLKAVATNPEFHRTLRPNEWVLPELVLSLRTRKGADGWSHALQLHPSGTADFVSFRPDELSHSIRWITRGPDQDALGLLLPATADADGYLAAKARGDLVVVPPDGTFHCQMKFGSLDIDDARSLRTVISTITPTGAASYSANVDAEKNSG